MPELPDLENYAANLNELLADKIVLGYQTFNPKSVSGDIVRFAALAVGKKCRVFRYGKELFFEVAGQTFGVHLMLNGELYLAKTTSAAEVKFKLFGIDFDDGESLYVTDFKQLARVTCFALPDYSVPDALSEAFGAEYFRMRLWSSRKTVKAMLLDQNFVKGIGNAYADEILWRARIHPESICCKLPDQAVDALFASVSDTLSQAITSIAEINPMLIRGEERSFLAVHNPKRRLSPTGAPILFTTTASKRTYFTAEQILYK